MDIVRGIMRNSARPPEMLAVEHRASQWRRLLFSRPNPRSAQVNDGGGQWCDIVTVTAIGHHITGTISTHATYVQLDVIRIESTILTDQLWIDYLSFSLPHPPSLLDPLPLLLGGLLDRIRARRRRAETLTNIIRPSPSIST